MLIVFASIIIIILGISYLIVRGDNNNSCYMSFMETFNLTDIPIITFFVGDSKVNFLLDTGASQSYISKAASKYVTGKESICDMDITCANGVDRLTCKSIDTTLTFKNTDFDVTLIVNEKLDVSFESLKKDQGIILHGIIGTDFFNKYSYIIDFDKYVAYSKK